MPLRDALRGVRTARSVSLQILRPARPRLPVPLRQLARGAGAAASRASALALGRFPPGRRDLTAATAYLHATRQDRSTRQAFATVFARGLDRCLADRASGPVLVSETAIAACLARHRREDDPEWTGHRRAAELARILSRRRVAGRLPGTGLGTAADLRATIDMAIAATMLWLCAGRAATAAGEKRMLAMAREIVATLAPEITDAFASPARLERQLASLSAMLSGHDGAAPAAVGLPVRKAVRSLDWFLTAYGEQQQLVSRETGIRFTIDRARLTAAFVEWLAAFENQKPNLEEDRLAYVGFAAGLMLRALVRAAPVAADPDRVPAEPGTPGITPAEIWPEGYLHVTFCLRIRGLVLEQEFYQPAATGPAFSDPEAWWSFRENAREDPSLAIAFLELFADGNPAWTMPDSFQPDRAGAGNAAPGPLGSGPARQQN